MTRRWASPRLIRRSLLASLGLLGVGLVSRPLWTTEGTTQSIVAISRKVLGEDFASDEVLTEFAHFYIQQSKDPGQNQSWPWSWRRELFVRSAGSYGPLFEVAKRIGFAPLTQRLSWLEQDLTLAFIRNSNLTYREPHEPVSFIPRPPIEPFSCFNYIARFDAAD